MAQLPNFNPAEHEPSKAFDPLPIGEYPMVFIESEMKLNKKENGYYLQLTAEVVDGEYKGRKVWERLNIDNPNQTAVEIAQRDLSAICHALGLQNSVITDSAQLHGRPFMGSVKIRPAGNGYNASNEFKEYKPYAVAGSTAPTPAPVAAPAPVQATPTQMATQAAAASAPAPAPAAPAAEFWKSQA